MSGLLKCADPIRTEVAPFAAMHAKTATQRVMMLQRNFPYTGYTENMD